MNAVKTPSRPMKTSPAHGPSAGHSSRRFSDSIRPGGRNLKFDRRANGSDRRINNAQQYHGAPRRITIDRRSSYDERRDDNKS